MYTRREFGMLTLAGLVRLKPDTAGMGVGLKPDTTTGFDTRIIGTGATGTDSVVNGVRVGVQTYSFRDLPRTPGGDAVDTVIKAMTECGLSECELFAPQLEPQFNAGGRGTRGARGGAPSPAAQKAREDLR